MSLNGKKIVVIGGGNGSSTVINSLKNDFSVTAIVSMADDGGSTGRLRKELGVSATGDVRQCLVAFTGSEESKKLFSYRFSSGELEGHSFGNIFLSTAEKNIGSFYQAIDDAKQILNIKNGEIIPVTDDKPELVMDYQGKTTEGVYKIANTQIDGRQAEFKLDPQGAKLSAKAQKSIEEADLIIIAPGNFYCSIIPALLVDGISSMLAKAKVTKVLISNLVNFSNHTKGFSTHDYLEELSRITNVEADVVVANNSKSISGKGEVVTQEKLEYPDVKVIEADLVSSEEIATDPNDKIAQIRSNIRHDSSALNKIITQIIRS